MKFSEKIKQQRVKQGISKSKLARMMGCTRMNIINWENGKYQPRMNNYLRLLKILEIKP